MFRKKKRLPEVHKRWSYGHGYGFPEKMLIQELGQVKFSKSPRTTNKRDKDVF